MFVLIGNEWLFTLASDIKASIKQVSAPLCAHEPNSIDEEADNQMSIWAIQMKILEKVRKKGLCGRYISLFCPQKRQKMNFRYLVSSAEGRMRLFFIGGRYRSPHLTMRRLKDVVVLGPSEMREPGPALAHVGADDRVILVGVPAAKGAGVPSERGRFGRPRAVDGMAVPENYKVPLGAVSNLVASGSLAIPGDVVTILVECAAFRRLGAVHSGR
ncbi:hypothetical protein [Fodinicurvata sp. EGI_FJ10296]|uniref:hypothetical protein n=1 Tax=Fodinicurvata sp. EGI_FJ10296 TaxID=3231908 RepID=UPI003455B1E6